MGALPRRVMDEEDVALTPCIAWSAAPAGQFPNLSDETDLWRLLVTITVRKARAQRRRHFAGRCGGGNVRGESIFVANDDAGEPAGLGAVKGSEPTPEFAAQVAEELRVLFDRIDDPLLATLLAGNSRGTATKKSP